MNLDRITINPEICHGQPVIRGLRYPVEFILDLLSGGTSMDALLLDYPDLQHEDIMAALAFGARMARVQRMELLAA